MWKYIKMCLRCQKYVILASGSGWNLSRKTRLEKSWRLHRISSKSEQWGSSYGHFFFFIGQKKLHWWYWVVFGGIWLYLVVSGGILLYLSGILWYLEGGGGGGGGGPPIPYKVCMYGMVCMYGYGMVCMVWHGMVCNLNDLEGRAPIPYRFFWIIKESENLRIESLRVWEYGILESLENWEKIGKARKRVDWGFEDFELSRPSHTPSCGAFYLPDRAGDFLDRSGARKSWSKLPISSKSELFEFSKTQFYFSLTFLDENWNNVSFGRKIRFVKSGWNLSRKTRLEIWNPVHRISSKSEQWGSSYGHFDFFIGKK